MVFETRSPRRARIFTGLVVAIVLALAFLLADFLLGVFTDPVLKPDADRVLSMAIRHVDESVRDFAWMDDPAAEAVVPRKTTREDFLSKPQLRTAFVVAEDQRSVMDYQRHADALDAAFVTWFSITSKDGRITRLPSCVPAEDLFGKGRVVLPVVTNADAEGNWRSEDLAALLADESASARLIEDLKREVIAMKADGVNVDFEQFTADERDNFSYWIKRLCQSFHKDHLLVTVDLPLYDEGYDYEYVGNEADAVVLMAYDEHYPGSSPGSIAGEGWFTDALDEMSKRIPPEKLVVALGAYAYDWNLDTGKPAQSLGYDDVMRLAADADGAVETSAGEVNPRFHYQDKRGDKHEVWLLDATTAWNQANIAKRYGIRGTSLWRTGLEDQGMWEFLKLPDLSAFDPVSLRTVRGGGFVSYTGDGEMLWVSSLPRTVAGRSISRSGWSITRNISICRGSPT